MIKALIFDFDGLILETEFSSLQSWQEIYQEYNCILPLDKWVLRIGASAEIFEPYEYLEGLLGYSLPREELTAKRRRRHLELIEREVALPGIEMYLAEAKRLGLKIGVASSSPRDWVLGHLARLGLAVHFDTMSCGDEVEHLKPNPDLYLAALAALDIRSDEAIALEDSPNGVTAAQRAGLFCIAVPNQITSRLPLDHADLRVSSLADIALGDLIALVERRQSATNRQEAIKNNL